MALGSSSQRIATPLTQSNLTSQPNTMGDPSPSKAAGPMSQRDGNPHRVVMIDRAGRSYTQGRMKSVLKGLWGRGSATLRKDASHPIQLRSWSHPAACLSASGQLRSLGILFQVRHNGSGISSQGRIDPGGPAWPWPGVHSPSPPSRNQYRRQGAPSALRPPGKPRHSTTGRPGVRGPAAA